MKRGQQLGSIQDLMQVPDIDQDRFWGNLVNRIDGGQVIPIVSNQLIYDQVFSRLLDQPEPLNPADCQPPNDLPILKMGITNTLSSYWAADQNVTYPFPDAYDLARVAQYVRSKERAPAGAKERYVHFIKEALILYASNNGVSRSTLRELLSSMNEYSFSKLVYETELLRFGPECTDPISVMASLPLPIYITTSYHDVLEQALIAMGKKPITQICPWLDQMPPLDPEHRPLESFTPSASTPLVYHLFGLDRYPLTLVLGEDDYLDFLVKVTIDRGTSSSIIPSYLQSALKVSWLMLMGYSLTSWDFRTLFRGLVSARGKDNIAYLNTIIQLSLTDQYDLPNNDQELRDYLVKAQDYLQDYFNPMAFEIQWKSPTSFLGDLKKEYRARRLK